MSPTTSVLAKLKTQKPFILTKVILTARGVVNAEMQNYKNVELVAFPFCQCTVPRCSSGLQHNNIVTTIRRLQKF